jgi:hypothetical protein
VAIEADQAEPSVSGPGVWGGLKLVSYSGCDMQANHCSDLATVPANATEEKRHGDDRKTH